MTTTTPETTPRRYPASEWLRTIEFPDVSDTGDDPPVHVCTRPVLFNGEEAKATVLREEVWVTAGPTQGTVVSFVVAADDVEFEDGRPVRLAGLAVVTPVEHEWTVNPETYFDHVAEHGRDYPTVVGVELATVRVYVHVRSVAFSA